MEIYNSRGPKQTWHQNEATPRESKRNAPTRGANEAFCLIKNCNESALELPRAGGPVRVGPPSPVQVCFGSVLL